MRTLFSIVPEVVEVEILRLEKSFEILIGSGRGSSLEIGRWKTYQFLRR